MNNIEQARRPANLFLDKLSGVKAWADLGYFRATHVFRKLWRVKQSK